jgi:hypothetical protein
MEIFLDIPILDLLLFDRHDIGFVSAFVHSVCHVSLIHPSGLFAAAAITGLIDPHGLAVLGLALPLGTRRCLHG